MSFIHNHLPQYGVRSTEYTDMLFGFNQVLAELGSELFDGNQEDLSTR